MPVEPALHPSERIDRFARRIYGSEQGGTVEALLDANPGLATVALAIPGGTLIEVPDIDPQEAEPQLRPWE